MQKLMILFVPSLKEYMAQKHMEDASSQSVKQASLEISNMFLTREEIKCQESK